MAETGESLVEKINKWKVGMEEKGLSECGKNKSYDMIGMRGGAGEASRACVRSAWVKFKELASILTS